MRYLRLWRRALVVALMRMAEDRVHTALVVLGGLGEQALLLVAYVVFYRFTDEIAGWTAAEALLLLGIFWIFDGVWSSFIGGSLRLLPEEIRSGGLDGILLRPVNTQFLISCHVAEVYELAKVVTGLAVVVHAGTRAGVAWSPGAVLAAAGIGASGLALLYALRFCIAAGTFWAMRVGELYGLFSELFWAGRYPVDYFPRPMREVLTYVIPVAFTTTFPAQALLGTADLRLLPAGLACAAAMLVASHVVWRVGLRRYASASS